jgi:hypothetical protein
MAAADRPGRWRACAFFVEKIGQDFLRVLGGNQSDRVRIATYPVNGPAGATIYHLLSIRR